MAKKNTLPQLVSRKIYKTGQTRGAEDNEIYQNRVLRNNTALIPFHVWTNDSQLQKFALNDQFEKGYIVLVSPDDYFILENENLSKHHLSLGTNALIFYQLRKDWDNFNPFDKGWKPASSRTSPLEGNFVARIAATTSKDNGSKIYYGFTETDSKGAGIRLYEYASKKTINLCRIQLEAIFWSCFDSNNAAKSLGMLEDDISSRKNEIFNLAELYELWDTQALKKNRIWNTNSNTICPLCLEPLSALGFASRLQLAEGREVHDLTVTEVNLFHIEEVKYGSFNHKP